MRPDAENLPVSLPRRLLWIGQRLLLWLILFALLDACGTLLLQRVPRAFSGPYILLQTSGTLIAAVVAGIILLRWLDHRNASALGFALNRQAGALSGVGVGIGAAVLLFVCALMLLAGWLGFRPDDGNAGSWLVTMGRVATGKSSVAKELGKELQWPVFSSDQIRKTVAGIPLKDRAAPELRAKLYSREMTEASYKKLLDEGFAALAPHSGVILDATFSSRVNRQLLREQCAKRGVWLQVVELEASKNEIMSRLRARDQSGHEISDARLEDFEKLDAIYESPSELAPDLVKVSTSQPLSETLKSVLQQLAEKQVSAAARCRSPGRTATMD